jgi:hypothetical protein
VPNLKELCESSRRWRVILLGLFEQNRVRRDRYQKDILFYDPKSLTKNRIAIDSPKSDLLQIHLQDVSSEGLT